MQIGLNPGSVNPWCSWFFFGGLHVNSHCSLIDQKGTAKTWLVGQGHPSEKWWTSSMTGWSSKPNLSGKIKLMATKPPTRKPMWSTAKWIDTYRYPPVTLRPWPKKTHLEGGGGNESSKPYLSLRGQLHGWIQCPHRLGYPLVNSHRKLWKITMFNG